MSVPQGLRIVRIPNFRVASAHIDSASLSSRGAFNLSLDCAFYRYLWKFYHDSFA